jgi:hypothetical protein
VSADIPQNLREQQLSFANHLRNPEQYPAPENIEQRRLRVYRNLFFNNISNLLANCFPVIRSILSDDKWQALMRAYYARHRCETPLFPFIAGEFASYLSDETEVEKYFPFLAELAQYEWSEIALRHADAEEHLAISAKPRLSALCWPLVFAFPVHRIGKDYLPVDKPAEPTYLLVYRNADDEVKFVESSPATFRLLQLLQDESLQGMPDVLRQLVHEMQHPDPELLGEMLMDTTKTLMQFGVLFKPS